MHCRTKKYSIPALLLGALIFAGCSGDANPKPPPGNGNGTGGADAGTNVPSPDAGNNSSSMDSGVVDPGPTGPCPPNYPGCRCTPDDVTGMAMEPSQGSCVDPAAVCAPYETDGQMPPTVTLAICLYQCMSDADCTGKLVGNPGDNTYAVTSISS